MLEGTNGPCMNTCEGTDLTFTCSTCTGPFPTSPCLTCISPNWLLNDRCVTTCVTEKIAKCATCGGPYAESPCLTCQPNYFLNPVNKTCDEPQKCEGDACDALICDGGGSLRTVCHVKIPHSLSSSWSQFMIVGNGSLLVYSTGSLTATYDSSYLSIRMGVEVIINGLVSASVVHVSAPTVTVGSSGWLKTDATRNTLDGQIYSLTLNAGVGLETTSYGGNGGTYGGAGAAARSLSFQAKEYGDPFFAYSPGSHGGRGNAGGTGGVAGVAGGIVHLTVSGDLNLESGRKITSTGSSGGYQSSYG